jgi:Spy/CpxP family protein refolding chaperone
MFPLFSDTRGFEVMAELGLERNSTEVRALGLLSSELMEERMRGQLDRQLRAAGQDKEKRDAVSAKLRALDAKAAEETARLLTPEQFARLKEIHLQLAGPHALAEPYVTQALGIDEVQKDKIAAALDEFIGQKNSNFAQLAQPGKRPSFDEVERRENELAAERNRKIDEILSAEQKAKLAEMRGKPFPLFPYQGYMLTYLVPQAAAKIEFAIVEDKPGEGLKEVHLEHPDGTLTRAYLRPAALGAGVVANAALAQPKADGAPFSYYSVDITFTEDGAKKMAKLTQENVGKELAILLDGKVVSAAKIRSAISEKAQITGTFTKEQAEQLAKSIRGDPAP